MTSTTAVETAVEIRRVESSLGDWVKAEATFELMPNIEIGLIANLHPVSNFDDKIVLNITAQAHACSPFKELSENNLLDARFTVEQLTMLRDAISLALDMRAENN